MLSATKQKDLFRLILSTNLLLGRISNPRSGNLRQKFTPSFSSFQPFHKILEIRQTGPVRSDSDAATARSSRPPRDGRARTPSSSRSCRLHRRALPRSLTRTSSRLSGRPRRRPLTLSPPGRRRARSTPRRSSPSSPPWRLSTGLTAPTLLRGTMQLPSTRRRRSRRPRPGSRPSPRSQRSAGR